MSKRDSAAITCARSAGSRGISVNGARRFSSHSRMRVLSLTVSPSASSSGMEANSPPPGEVSHIVWTNGVSSRSR